MPSYRLICVVTCGNGTLNEVLTLATENTHIPLPFGKRIKAMTYKRKERGENPQQTDDLKPQCFCHFELGGPFT